jgi:hypothetical protein
MAAVMPIAALKSIVFLFVGLMVTLASFAMLRGDAAFLAEAQKASGLVIATPYGGSHPQIRFHVSGSLDCTYSQNGMIFGYRTGDAVTVLYNPKDPCQSPSVGGFLAIWGMDIVTLALGLVFLWGGWHVWRTRHVQ